MSLSSVLTDQYEPVFLAIAPRSDYTHIVMASAYFQGSTIQERINDVFTLLEWEGITTSGIVCEIFTDDEIKGVWDLINSPISIL